MRITPQTLQKIARDTVARRTRSDRNLLAIYLHGSLLEADPLLGGTTDIDLVFIHDDSPVVAREIQPLTDEVHLDIAHHERNTYRHGRDLRLHAWLGPTIFSCKVLYDPQHFMDFTQASVRGQFNRPENVLERARGQADHAREIWLELHSLTAEPALKDVALYLRAVEHAANAVASLSGPPLTERRFLMRFPGRVEAIGRPGLYPGLLGLLGAPAVHVEALPGWLPAWEAAYRAIPTGEAPLRLHPERLSYYRQAFEKILQSERPQDVLWPMLHTWMLAAQHLTDSSDEYKAWQERFNLLGLYGAGFRERVAALDAYLDLIEETLESWGRSSGALPLD
jgi:hypothetical protein